ncbi:MULTISPECIES: phage tail protein [unclassified Duganella]|uniref:phage tail protein n=1 Tax=unclassified Duganella TaxID=2636909 RepID=UPI00087E0581|nr:MULTISPECIES: phage tail protein [unclassified Duganella]SDF58617.1 Phage Tail Collar Domain [Duganella sp. OV458]SDI69975.1 Phage Tail Collar Domain [Duganella sp. OV510]
MISGAVPVGTILPFAGPLALHDAPTQRIERLRWQLFRDGWRLCDGASLLRGDYPELSDLLGSAYGGDASHFNLPDLQGCFMRGVSGNLAADNAERKAVKEGGNVGNRVGSHQADAFQSHEHDYTEPVLLPDAMVVLATEGSPLYTAKPMQSTTNYVPADTVRTADETRPVNLNLNFIIRCR